MKKLFILCSVITLTVFSCKNMENDFPDNKITTGYFPEQYPVRTIILGNYIYDNSNDNAHKFVISAHMGGVYQNKKDRTLYFVVDESLCEEAFFTSLNTDTIRPLPKKYYQLSDPVKIIIPAGDDKGGVEVQLTDAFFNDPLAIKNSYVVPLRLTGFTDLDSILQGRPAVDKLDPDRRKSGDWTIAPKDFVMFAVKFINPYDGSYLHYGSCVVKDAGGAKVDEKVYSAQYVEQNEIWTLKTDSRTGVTLTGSFKSTLTGTFRMRLNFTSDDYLASGGVNCTITAEEGSPYTITGTGKYTIGTEEYGGKKRDAISLTYTISNGVYTYTATDMLVFRNRNVNYETFTPTIIPWL